MLELDTLPTAFHFTVSFGRSLLSLDCSFQEVGGIGTELETEALSEGGENRYVLQLPKASKSTRLTLKRGVTSLASPLALWCKQVLEEGLAEPIQTRVVYVFLLNGLRLPVRCWSFECAYPVKWSVEGFNSTRNALAVESIELSYLMCKRNI